MKGFPKFRFKKLSAKKVELNKFSLVFCFSFFASVWLHGQTCYCDETNSIKVGSGVGVETLTEAIGLTLLDDVSPSDPIAPPVNLCITGDFLIDKTYFFDESFIHVAPDSKITVDNGFDLGFIDSEVYGCEEMWNSIYLEGVPYGWPHAGIHVINSTISDAEVAIDIGVYADLYLDNSIFLNNHIGVRSVSADGGTPNVLRFDGNLFYSDLNSLPPHEDQLMYAGVYLERVYGFTIGSLSGAEANTFITIKNGIVAHASSFTVHSAGIFPYLITELPSANLNEDFGNGILMYDSRCMVTHTSFDDNIAAIHAVRSSVEATDNVINEGVGYGLAVIGTKNGSVKINENLLKSFQACVYLSNLDNTLVNIENNSMETDEEFEVPDVDAWAAIAIDGCTFIEDRRAVITNNSLVIKDAWYGITIAYSTGVDVVNNPSIVLEGGSNFESEPFHLVGINIEGGGGHTVIDNTIIGEGEEVSFSGDKYIAGMRVAYSNDNSFCCNNLDELEIGQRFDGPSPSTRFYNTYFNTHDVALLMDPDGIIGVQDGADTQWGEVSLDVGARHENSNPFFCLTSQFLVDDYDLPLTPDYPSQIDPNPQSTGVDWFLNMATTTQSCCTGFAPPNDDELDALDDKIISKEIDSGTAYSNTTNWLLERHLFRKLDNYPSLIVANTAIDTFYDEKLVSNVGAFHAVAQNIAGLAGQPEVEVGLYQQNLDSIFAWLRRLVVTDSLLIGADSLETVALLTERADMTYKMGVAEVENDDLLDTIAAYQNDWILGYLTENDAISPAEIYEANEKTVNDIYLSTVALGIFSLDSLQKAALDSIVWQCPKMGGSVVYRARALYHMEEMVLFDDLDNCDLFDALIGPKQGPTIKTPHVGKTSLSPNPATQEVILTIAEGTVADRVKVVNLNGQAVAAHALPADSRRFSFSVVGIPDGIYFVELKDGRKTVHTEKLIINK